MKKTLAQTFLAIAGLLVMLSAEVQSTEVQSTKVQDSASNNPIVVMHTSKGPITLQLYADKAPITAANFLAYVKSGHYEGSIFHRVRKRFMIQGGGYNSDLEQFETGEPIINESNNGLHNERWTIAMARTDDPDSATAQFFINVKMNSNLDAGAGKLGYAVFGIVTDGFHVVKAIEKTATMSKDEFADLPIEPVIIERIDIQ